jgi:hypothetical protein
MDEEALGRLSDAAFRACNPRMQAVERLGEAVAAAFAVAGAVDEAFAASARQPGGDQELHLKLMDVNAQARALRSRAESRYGPAEELYARAQAHGGAPSARVWC